MSGVGDICAIIGGMHLGFCEEGQLDETVKALRRFTKRDFDKAASTWDEEPRRVRLAGNFERKKILSLLSDAGFVDFRDKTADVIVKGATPDARQYPVFLITARKPV